MANTIEPLIRRLDAYPCCHYTHRLIDAATQLAGDLRLADIEGVELEMPAPYHAVVANTAPASADEARFSLAYCVASALLDGDVTLASFSESALKRRAIAALMPRIHAVTYERPALRDLAADAPDTLRVRLRNRDPLSIQVADVRGAPSLPLDEAALRRKAAQCCGPAPAGAQADALVAYCLDDTSDAMQRRVGAAPFAFLPV